MLDNRQHCAKRWMKENSETSWRTMQGNSYAKMGGNESPPGARSSYLNINGQQVIQLTDSAALD
ncbi:hypothetical protein KIN20_016113 [Parelaphostrongylus tenuis]|uniref:Uncharacterized protein n=1 Tax=Parelaphostrongylus tenuis TaxID=148309 RepID=A0AAD5N105_PARTN|nr:hypothetical protein KIN20_016113 [Parelaphostrongylus tenuis]